MCKGTRRIEEAVSRANRAWDDGGAAGDGAAAAAARRRPPPRLMARARGADRPRRVSFDPQMAKTREECLAEMRESPRGIVVVAMERHVARAPDELSFEAGEQVLMLQTLPPRVGPDGQPELRFEGVLPGAVRGSFGGVLVEKLVPPPIDLTHMWLPRPAAAVDAPVALTHSAAAPEGEHDSYCEIGAESSPEGSDGEAAASPTPSPDGDGEDAADEAFGTFDEAGADGSRLLRARWGSVVRGSPPAQRREGSVRIVKTLQPSPPRLQARRGSSSYPGFQAGEDAADEEGRKGSSFEGFGEDEPPGEGAPRLRGRRSSVYDGFSEGEGGGEDEGGFNVDFDEAAAYPSLDDSYVPGYLHVGTEAEAEDGGEMC